MIALHRLADGSHRRFVFGVGNMIGKTAVRLQKLRARRIRSERLQDFIDVKSARAVPRVYENPLALQGLRFARRAADLFDEILRIGVEIRLFYPASARLFGKRRRGGKGEDFFDVLRFQAALRREKFQAVAVEGEVAGRNHHRAVRGPAFVF